MSNTSIKGPPIAVWWIIWAAIMVGLVAIFATAGLSSPSEPIQALRYLPLLPLLISSALRWIVLPRFSDRRSAFPVFVIGLALAESCGLLGVFLVPEMRQTYFALSVIGLLQYMPFFAARYQV